MVSCDLAPALDLLAGHLSPSGEAKGEGKGEGVIEGKGKGVYEVLLEDNHPVLEGGPEEIGTSFEGESHRRSPRHLLFELLCRLSFSLCPSSLLPLLEIVQLSDWFHHSSSSLSSSSSMSSPPAASPSGWGGQTRGEKEGQRRRAEGRALGNQWLQRTLRALPPLLSLDPDLSSFFSSSRSPPSSSSSSSSSPSSSSSSSQRVEEERAAVGVEVLSRAGQTHRGMFYLLGVGQWEMAVGLVRRQTTPLLFSILLNHCLLLSDGDKLRQVWDFCPQDFGPYDLIRMITNHFRNADFTSISSSPSTPSQSSSSQSSSSSSSSTIDGSNGKGEDEKGEERGPAHSSVSKELHLLVSDSPKLTVSHFRDQLTQRFRQQFPLPSPSSS